MNRPTDLRASRILFLFTSLRDAAADYAHRAEQIARETRAKRYTAEQAHLQKVEALSMESATAAAAVSAQWEGYKNDFRQRHKARTDSFQRYQHRIERDLPAMMQKERESWLGKQQFRRIQAQSQLKKRFEEIEAIASPLEARLNAAKDRLLAVLKATGGRLSRQDDVLPKAKPLSEMPARVESIETQAADYEEQLAAKGGGLLKMFSKPAVNLQQLSTSVHDYETAVAELNASIGAANAEAQAAHDALDAQITADWNRTDEIAQQFKAAMQTRLATQIPRCLQRNERLLQRNLKHLDEQKAAQLAQAESPFVDRRNQLESRFQLDMAAFDANAKKRWTDLEAEWQAKIPVLLAQIDEAAQITSTPWSADYTAPTTFPPHSRFAELKLDLSKEAAVFEKDTPLSLAGHEHVSLPLALTFPQEASLLIETDDDGGKWVPEVMNSLIFRILKTAPPGKAHFTIIDAVGLGQNFAGLMHLADYEPALINRRIWTQRDHIEERLQELNEHVEKVIQMYLRNEYATITEYNEQAGSVAEKYHFLVIAGLPAGFSESAMSRLKSILASGPRCGVFTLVHWDRRQNLPDGLSAEDLRKFTVSLLREKGVVSFGGISTLTLDPFVSDEIAADLAHQIGQASIDSNRVQVPFSIVAPKEMWSESTTNELRIAIGRTGATKLQYLAIGKGTKQHALLAGKTGSGKSTLLHIIITNLALTCSPDEIEFYLIDFKKGVEFKCYADAKLPHAKVIAIESDREFALSVLQRIDEELKRRGELYRKLGAQDLAGYKRAGGTEPMPR